MPTQASSPSPSSTIVNIPEVKFLDVNFNYNYYVPEERVTTLNAAIAAEKLPRYVKLSWQMPELSQFELNRPIDSNRGTTSKNYIRDNSSKIIFEDDFSPNYLSFVFSDVQDIQQASSDLEIASRIGGSRAESVFQMAGELAANIAKEIDDEEDNQQEDLSNLMYAYTKFADFPDSSLGLRVLNNAGSRSTPHRDTSEFLSSISDSITLNVQLNSLIVPDLFVGSKLKNDNFQFLNENVIASQAGGWPEQISLPLTKTYSKNLNNRSIYMRGYIIKRYLVTPNGFVFEESITIEDIQKNVYIDSKVLYGKTYIYTISVVAELSILIFDKQNNESSYGNVLIASRPISKSIECFEYVPPDPPEDIRFNYDYVKNNLIISWSMPLNPQMDVKQFQIMRRKSISDPFELIMQYSFDDSIPGNGNLKFDTGEIIDGNRLPSPEFKHLLKLTNAPVFIHVDEDFFVNKEFSTASSYIYSICSIDAHGMISNYSAQHHVSFDVYKNRLVSKVVCDAGSPRQYPNMNLKMDAFKDSMTFGGYGTTKMQIYFAPEYLSVMDEDGRQFRVVNGSTKRTDDYKPDQSDSYYVLQLMNLNNQKMQLLKMKIYDQHGITTR